MQFPSEYGRYGGRVGPPLPAYNGRHRDYWAGVRARRVARASLRALMGLPLPIELRRRAVRAWRRQNLDVIARSNVWRQRYRRV